MKIYGKTNIFSGNILSNVSEESNKPQNLVFVPDLTLFDSELLDREITIIDVKTHSINTTHGVDSDWKDCIDVIDGVQYIEHNVELNRFSRRRFVGNVLNYLTIDSELFNFGAISSPDNFVIDFNLYFNSTIVDGTLLYNGSNTGQVDLEINKNLLITTSGSVLIKDPNFQANPTTQLNAVDDGYLNVYRPRLKSTFKFDRFKIYHVAIIRSGETTYLAINGKIEASAPSVEYFHYDPVKIGAGYIGATNADIWNLRISKGTDRGWTKSFTPPQYDVLIDQFTDFLLNSDTLNDITNNHSRNTVGSVPVKYEDLIEPYYFSPNEFFSKVNLTSPNSTSTDSLSIIFPNILDIDARDFKIQIDSNTIFSYLLFYSPNNTIINPQSSYVNLNVAVIQYYALNFAIPLRFQYSAGSWFQMFNSPNENALSLSWVSTFSGAGTFNYGVLYPDIRGNIVNISGTIKISNPSNLKYETDHLLNRNLKLIKLSGISSPLDITENDQQPLANTIEFIFRINSALAAPINLLYANPNGSTSLINLNTNHQLMSRQVRYYYRVIDYDTSNYRDVYESYFANVDSAYSSILTIGHWYHVYLIHDNSYANNVTYIKCNCTIDDLTINSRLMDNVSLLNQNYSPTNTSGHYNTSGTSNDYDYSTQNVIYTRTPRFLNCNVDIDMLMLRIKGVASPAPTVFTKYYSYGEFLQSC